MSQRFPTPTPPHWPEQIHKPNKQTNKQNRYWFEGHKSFGRRRPPWPPRSKRSNHRIIIMDKCLLQLNFHQSRINFFLFAFVLVVVVYLVFIFILLLLLLLAVAEAVPKLIK
jgi:hypothetical protein